MLDISYPDKPTKLVYPLETATPPKPKPTFYYPEDDDDLSYCQIWCLRVFGHAATWPFGVVSIPSLNATPVMTLAR